MRPTSMLSAAVSVALLAAISLTGCAGAADVPTSDPVASAPLAPVLPVPTPTSKARATDDELSDAADAIMDVAAPSFEEYVAELHEKMSGYAGLVLNDKTDQLDLHWKGEVPHEVTDVIDEFPAVVTNLIPVSLSSEDMDRAQEKLGPYFQQDGRYGENVIMASAGTSADYSGIDVEFIDPDGDVDLAKVAAELSTAAGVRVRVSIIAGPLPTAE